MNISKRTKDAKTRVDGSILILFMFSSISRQSKGFFSLWRSFRFCKFSSLLTYKYVHVAVKASSGRKVADTEREFKEAKALLSTDPKAGYTRLRACALTGHAGAQNEVGDCYYYGKGRVGPLK